MSDGASATLSVHESGRTLDPAEIVLGGIWLGPGGGDGGDGNRPDLGQENATAAVEAALRSGICEFDTAPWYGAGASEEMFRSLYGAAYASLPAPRGGLSGRREPVPRSAGLAVGATLLERSYSWHRISSAFVNIFSTSLRLS